MSAWAIGLIDWCFGDESVRAKAPETEVRATLALTGVLASLADLDEVEPVADLDALRRCSTLELGRRLSRVGKLGTGVLVAPLSSAVGLSLDVVYVVGLAEGLCPARSTTTRYCPTPTRGHPARAARHPRPARSPAPPAARRVRVGAGRGGVVPEGRPAVRRAAYPVALAAADSPCAPGEAALTATHWGVAGPPR